MTDEARLLEIGFVGRPHGLRGDVLVRLTTNNPERLDAGSVLDAGGAPLTVRSSQPHKDRFLVSFHEVASREAAEALGGTPLRAPAVEDDRDGYWVHDLIGTTVVDLAGEAHGTVAEVLANPASDILVLDSGPLVPLGFVTWDDEGRLVVDGPDGLLDPR